MKNALMISGIGREAIEKLYLNPARVLDLECNIEECKKIISYLKLIGIKNIDDLFTYEFGLFLKTKEEVVDSFSKFETSYIVNLINDNFENINLLFE